MFKLPRRKPYQAPMPQSMRANGEAVALELVDLRRRQVRFVRLHVCGGVDAEPIAKGGDLLGVIRRELGDLHLEQRAVDAKQRRVADLEVDVGDTLLDAHRQELVEKDGVFTFTVQPKQGEKSFHPVNTNGSQRGWRPIVEFLPKRLKDIEVVEGADLNPVIADDFILVPNPRKCDPERKYRIVLRASEVK